MNRFAVFIYERYYPEGGWGDFYTFSPSMADAKKALLKGLSEKGGDFGDAVDLETGKIVAKVTRKEDGEIIEHWQR